MRNEGRAGTDRSELRPAGSSTSSGVASIPQRIDPGKTIGSGYSAAFAESDPR
jgi:hypothetical protein